MAKILTIQIPDILEHQLRLEAQKLNLPLEEFVLQSLTQVVSAVDEPDPDETPTETLLEGIHQGLHEAFTGQTIPLSQMWEGIDTD
jgi:hypothetical protein